MLKTNNDFHYSFYQQSGNKESKVEDITNKSRPTELSKIQSQVFLLVCTLSKWFVCPMAYK